jgi:hypothetical protein
LTSNHASPYKKAVFALSEVASTSPGRGLITNASPSRGSGAAPRTPKSTHTQPLKPSGSKKMNLFGLSVGDTFDCAATNDSVAIHISEIAASPRRRSVLTMKASVWILITQSANLKPGFPFLTPVLPSLYT